MFEELANFHFIRPWWLMLLLAVPLLLLLQNRFAQRANNWHKVIEEPLFNALVGANASTFVRVTTITTPLALICAMFALAGPTYEKLPQPVETKDDPLVIVLDLSLSMTSEDLQPSRTERAKFKINDILQAREEGLTALVVYAGDAYIVTPLTTDDQNILNLLPTLDPTIMPVKGSNATAALELAIQQFDSFEIPYGEILFITDGISNFSGLRDTVDSRFPISILGVGTRGGTDARGRELHLNEDLLSDFARVTGGRYRTISRSDDDIDFLLAGSGPETTKLLEDQTFDAWHDLGYLLILPCAFLVALSMRRGGIAIVLAVVTVHIEAGWLDDLWIPRDRQGYAAHEEGNFKEAGELFKDPSWQGVANYRNGEFETAQGLFAQDESLSAIYNQGNALAWQGKLSEAIAAYDAVLTTDPDHVDALHNKQTLEKLIQDLQNQQSSESDSKEGDESEDSQQNQGNSSQDQQSQSSDSQSQPSEQQEQNQQQSESDDSQQAEEEESADAQQQEQSEQEEQSAQEQELAAALPEEMESSEERELREIQEAWLRRIPDDPGGLLRRKFEAESNARIERGDLNRSEVGSAW